MDAMSSRWPRPARRSLAIIATLALSLSALPSGAGEARLTLYDDGRACPASCDAHVVFHPTLNGSAHAHKPGSTKQPCVSGQACEICFDHHRDQCVQVTYRGAGPPEHTFDFTPAYFLRACAGEDGPEPLREMCVELDKAAARLRSRRNCIAGDQAAACKQRMAIAQRNKQADSVEYEKCLRVGETQYNAGKPRSQQRINDCGYMALKLGGPNSKGLRWHKLLPGACRQGTFVGRDGLDCCSGIPMADGYLGIECSIYYPKDPALAQRPPP